MVASSISDLSLFEMVACAQCRQRKVSTSRYGYTRTDCQIQVRCQGGPTRCEACTRLGFQCSYSATATSGSGSVPNMTRKRGTRACDACRAQKARCTGDTPKCLRCQQLIIPCHYSLSVRQYKSRDVQRPSITKSVDDSTALTRSDDNNNAAHSTSTTASETMASPDTSVSETMDRYCL